MARPPEKCCGPSQLDSRELNVPETSVVTAGHEAAFLLRRLGDRIRRVRIRVRWSRERLSRESRIDAGVLKDIELGTCDPPIKDLIKIAEMLGVSMADLLAD